MLMLSVLDMLKPFIDAKCLCQSIQIKLRNMQLIFKIH